MYNTYIAQGLRVFPCKADKSPATPNGFYDAALDWQLWHGDLVGLPTGDINGLVVIDLDAKDGFDSGTLKESLSEIGHFPETFTVQTPSGGLHLYYAIEKTSIQSKTRFFSKALPIDIRANGGYVIAPDFKTYFPIDAEIDDIRALCSPLPAWIENYKPIHEYTDNQSVILPESEIQEIRSALNYIDSDDRDIWVKIGMALKSTGCASARGLWDEWSQKSDKYDANDQGKKWKSFKPSDITIASVFHEAKKSGWRTVYNIQERNNNEKIDDEETEKYNKAERKQFPPDLLIPPGVVGMFAHYINSKSIKEQKILSLGASIAAIGALLGRRIQTDTGIRTNVYCIGIGESGCGKEAARSVIKEVFHHINCGEMAAVEDIASDSAITTALDKTPAQIFLLDEIGRFLKVTNSEYKSPHLYNINTVLMKLYSNANQAFYGKAYADADKKVHIDNPHLCIYGTTVPDTLYEGLSTKNISDGLLSRVMLFLSEDADPEKQRAKNFLQKPPADLVRMLKDIRNKPINPQGGPFVNPQIVPMSVAAKTMLYEFDDQIRALRQSMREENRHEAVYNRTAQVAEQIALIIAGGTNIDEPIIDVTEIEYGIKLARHLSDTLLYISENYIASNEREHDVQRIFNLINAHPNGITISQITRKTQGLPGYVRNDIIDTLIDGYRIRQDYFGDDGKRKKRVLFPVR